MSLIKGCSVLGGIVLLLIFGGFRLLSLGESEHIAASPVEYAALSESAQEMLPPFAEHIYFAEYADWQVGEWCYCFEIQPDNEEALKNWCREACAGRIAVQPLGHPFHLTTPDWWNLSSNALLLGAVAGDLKHPMGFSAWYDASQNKVWFMYNR